MNGLEPVRVIVKEKEHQIAYEIKKLLLQTEQLMPFVKERESELSLVDAQYLKIHDKQEALKQEKTDVLIKIDFPRLYSRILLTR